MFSKSKNKNLRKKFLSKSKKAGVKTQFNFFTIVSTWFYIGKIPIAPGTFASLSVYPLYKFSINSSTSYAEAEKTFMFLFVVLFFLGLWCVHKFQEQTKTFDSKVVVIDEVVGQLLTFAISYKWLYKFSINYSYMIDIRGDALAFFLGVLLFRYFDISKPLFIKYVDRSFKGAFGVILDDVLAALFSSGSIYIIYSICDAIQRYI